MILTLAVLSEMSQDYGNSPRIVKIENTVSLKIDNHKINTFVLCRPAASPTNTLASFWKKGEVRGKKRRNGPKQKILTNPHIDLDLSIALLREMLPHSRHWLTAASVAN